MSVRIGVDVGGTFTKAVACDVATAAIVARAVVATTHESAAGVATGIAEAVRLVAAQVRERDAGTIQSVAHSTTQAVNALLEGDTAKVGILAFGSYPDVARARRRTAVGTIGLAPGRSLDTFTRFVDATNGVDDGRLRAELDALESAGAASIAITEAYGVDDPALERRALAMAAEMGLPACAGHELTGLYGLEMRTVTAAINAAILPRSLETIRVVAAAVEAIAPGAPLLVMRGDGGAAELRTAARHPLLTAFSGPAASVTGVLRHTALSNAVVVEVGGTSTNVSVVRDGRPQLAYVRVLEHITNVRSMDVRVAGVGGGSMLRLERRWGRVRIADVGPRSAHIAALPYASFANPEQLADARAELIAPRSGDPAAYAVVNAGGNRYALTLTCAANAIGAVPDGAYAHANAESARLGFAALGAMLGGVTGERLALEAVERAADKVLPLVDDLLAEYRLARPTIVGVGGGAATVVPTLAMRRRLESLLPADGELISAIGDALSLVRIEIERSAGSDGGEALAAAHQDAEAAAIAAGVDPQTLTIESEPIPERHAIRVVATGAFSGDVATRPAPLDADMLRTRAAEVIDGAHRVARVGPHHVFAGATAADGAGPIVVLDDHGAVVADVVGRMLVGPGTAIADRVSDEIRGHTRHIGPVAVAPVIRILRGGRYVDLSIVSRPDELVDATLAECRLAGGDEIVVISARA